MVTDGVTAIVVPVPTNVEAQLPLYHLQVALVPNVPPTTDKLTEIPGQILFLFREAEAGARDGTRPVKRFPGEILAGYDSDITLCCHDHPVIPAGIGWIYRVDGIG